MKKVFIFFTLIVIHLSVRSQNLNLILSDTTVKCGSIVDVPIRVSNFKNIVALQFSLKWSIDKLSFNGIYDYGPKELAIDMNSFGTTDSSIGVLNFSWIDPSLLGKSYSDTMVLFVVRFVSSKEFGKTNLQIVNSPLIIEAIDSKLNSINVSVINGDVQNNCNPLKPLYLIPTSTKISCDSVIELPIRVKNFSNITALQFTYAWDPNILKFDSFVNLESSTLNLSLSNFGISLSDSGKIIFSWFDNNLNGKTLVDSSVLFKIRFIVLSKNGKTYNNFLNYPLLIEAIDSSLNPIIVNTFSGEVQTNCINNQNLPLFINDVTVKCGTYVEIPLRVNSFNSIISFKGKLKWDPNLLSFDSISNFGPKLLNQNISNFEISKVSSGSLNFIWKNNSFTGLSLPDSSALFYLRFKVIGKAGFTNLIIIDSTNETQFINDQQIVLSPLITNSKITFKCDSCYASISKSMDVCLNSKTPTLVTFKGYGGVSPYTFTYSINGGIPISITADSSDSISVVHNTISAGEFIYNLLNISSSNCSQQVNSTCVIKVLTPPVAGQLIGIQSVCEGASFLLSSNVKGGFWSSSNNGIASINSSTGLVTGVSAGIATITYTISGFDACPKALSSSPVVIKQLPSAKIQDPLFTSICQNSSLSLLATGGEFYRWYHNNTEIFGANTSNYNATLPGIYSVQSVDLEGCISKKSNSLTLTLISNPVVDFSNDKFCAKTLIQFNNLSDTRNSGSVNYNWSFGDGVNSSNLNPVHIFSKEGLYSVSLSVTPLLCPNLISKSTKNIFIESNPGNVRYKSVNSLISQNFQLSARLFENANYNWYPNTGLDNYKISNPKFINKKESEYLINIINSAGCNIVDTLLVRVFENVEIYVAEAFSPNADGKNDNLIPKLVGIQKLNYFKIFNRWGQLVFSTNREGDGWNGSYNGVKQQMDTYAWQSEGIDSSGAIIKRSGTFILIR